MFDDGCWRSSAAQPGVGVGHRTRPPARVDDPDDGDQDRREPDGADRVDEPLGGRADRLDVAARGEHQAAEELGQHVGRLGGWLEVVLEDEEADGGVEEQAEGDPQQAPPGRPERAAVRAGAEGPVRHTAAAASWPMTMHEVGVALRAGRGADHDDQASTVRTVTNDPGDPPAAAEAVGGDQHQHGSRSTRRQRHARSCSSAVGEWNGPPLPGNRPSIRSVIASTAMISATPARWPRRLKWTRGFSSGAGGEQRSGEDAEHEGDEVLDVPQQARSRAPSRRGRRRSRRGCGCATPAA